MRNNLPLKNWIKLGVEERKALHHSWEKYKGEGEVIVKELCELFKKKHGRSENIFDIRCGLFHGGDWVISVALKVGSGIVLPETFYGIRIVKLFNGLSADLKRKLDVEYKGNIGEFVDAEIKEFAKCFDFTHDPKAREWLIDYVKRC